MGETGRCLHERQKEHVRLVRELNTDRSEIAKHVAENGHSVDLKGISVIDKEPQWRRRIIKEAFWSAKLKSGNRVKHDIGRLL